MKYFTYSGNNLINAKLPDDATVLYPRPPLPGISKRDMPTHVRQAFDNPLGMPPLRDLVDGNSRILIAFDDNCQPFPATSQPDIRQVMIETLLEMLYSYGVKKENIELMCAVALHRKMKPAELAWMLGKRIMSDFYPQQLGNFDAEDPDDIVVVGQTDHGEAVETTRKVVESDLVIYVDSIQIPLNGGHKSVAVGMGTYNSIAPHHAPQMTQEKPHVMQPHDSDMHSSIERISRVILEHTKIMVLEAAMNNATYAPMMAYMSKPNDQCNVFEKTIKTLTPITMKLLPEPVRFNIFKNIRSDYSPIDINAGSIDEVHKPTLQSLKDQLLVTIRAYPPARGQLDLPGGFVDPGETAEQAVAREIKEELGLDVQHLTYFGSEANACYPYGGVNYHTLDLAFTCRVQTPTQARAADDVQEVRFLPLGEVRPQDFAFLSIQRIVQRFREASPDSS